MSAAAAVEVRFVVNGRPRTIVSDPERRLLGVLRDDLGLTGTKYGCGEGECGACTVLLDGSPIRSCQLPLAELAGRHITTIEGLGKPGRLTPVQQAFRELGAFQCGFCTPGMILAATALIQQHPAPSEGEIREALNENICRCCGYARILRAVQRAAVLTHALSENR